LARATNNDRATGQYAITALRTYLDEFGRRWSRTRRTLLVFVSRGGRQLTREMLWILVKKYVKRAA